MSKNSLPLDLNKKLWESNLVRFEKAKNSKKYAKIVDSLDQMNKMPTEQHILDRFKCLAANVKSRQERVVIVIKEVKILWKKLNLPIQKGKSTVERKIENVLNKYEKDSRKPGTVSQDTKDDLSSKDEEHFNTEEEKQDSDSGSQDSDALKEEEIV
ncbi:hypothetical protein HELRODRAFT_179310 [Helobdella robusta]|uniref:Uncharacterized protein n=1 Tax=Helobdella robusta TaxID=6412 RepID=T1FEJ0_HELRO|nr:hypothetical protein HELRODRAFT_179310 [Helobdella robusta]ESN95535.1 hypothetical protein HELRODRAFT_179310 [Helobdella robusta]